MKKQNLWKYFSVGLLGIIAIGLLTPVDAKPSPDNEAITSILELLLDTTFGLEEIKNEVQTIETDVGLVKDETDKIQMVKDNQYIPFIEKISGGFCSDGDPIAVSITINSSADPGTPFVVTSIIVTPTGDNVVNQLLVLNGWSVGGTLFGGVTELLTGVQSDRDPSIDIMGLPLRTGGNFPTQIVAESNSGFDDIEVRFVCFSFSGIDIDTIQVSGWKTAGDSVTVLYDP